MEKDTTKCRNTPASKINHGHLASFDEKQNNGIEHLIKLNSELLHSETFNETKFLHSFDEQIKTPILDALENFYNNPSVPLHIPGHARGEGILPKFRNLVGQKIIDLDITDEFDNLGTLHPADGPITEAQNLAAKAFGASETFFLTGGSSIGNLALALTATKQGEKVIVSRNCHRSVISGLVMSGAEPIWVMPEKLEEWGLWSAISPNNIEKLLDENPDTKVVWITNPTYEGIVTDIAPIVETCKKRNVTLLVDEAHGSLWKFNKMLPNSSLELGADAVVNSIHKTGGSFSQSSMLHLGKNSKINANELETNLRMLHSTSPSYMLLASLDAARAYLDSQYGLERIENTVQNSLKIRDYLNNINGVKCLSFENGVNIDLTKIYVMVEGLSGKSLSSILEIEYHIEVEAATDNGILALSNIGNTWGDLEYFGECIKSIVNSKFSDITYLEKTKYMPFHFPEVIYSPRNAFICTKEKVRPENSIGRICAEVIAECPPGIPVLVPGEKVTKEHLPYLTMYTSVWVIKE